MITFDITSYTKLKNLWKNSESKSKFIASYTQKETNFIPYLLPEDALQLSIDETIQILTDRFGKEIEDILLHEKKINSWTINESDTKWINSSNIVGINTRTVNNIFNVVKYALTIPVGSTLHNSLHILPLWETGVGGSIYAISSWNLNEEYFSEELCNKYPNLDTMEEQITIVINILHLMGFAIGLDVIPHTDRFSEIVLSNPSYFEWLQRKGSVIVDHSGDLYKKVEEEIFQFVKTMGSATKQISIPKTTSDLFALNEEDRIKILFGFPNEPETRTSRRVELIQALFKQGYEATPATMAPPYRGLKVKSSGDPNIDSNNLEWRDYEIIHPEPMSRVFGPLTRFKFYESKKNNKDWQIDFDSPRKEVFEYFNLKYHQFIEKFNFDFIRGDMSHVQMRKEGVPFRIDDYYDPIKYVKNFNLQYKKSFSYFAESFLAPYNIMAYGYEIDHLEATDADCVLGDLQSLEINDDEFFKKFRQYLDLKEYRKTKPSFTIITSDKDDPRFDKFYVKGNEFRYFIAMFLIDMPSYYSLGFETRDPHTGPAPNEFYTKLYVFHETGGPKKTSGSYKWGKNWNLFVNLVKIRLFAEKIADEIKDGRVQWILPPDSMRDYKLVIWIIYTSKPIYLFVANSEVDYLQSNLTIPKFSNDRNFKLELTFSIPELSDQAKQILEANEYRYQIPELEPGAVCVYKII